MPDQVVVKMRVLKAGLSLAKTHVLAPGSVTLKKVTFGDLRYLQFLDQSNLILSLLPSVLFAFPNR